MDELPRHPVPDQPALPVRADHAVRAEQPQGVRDRAVAHPDRYREIGYAQVTGVPEGKQDAEPVELAERTEHPGLVPQLCGVGQHRAGVTHLARIDDLHAVEGRGEPVHGPDRIADPSPGRSC